MTTEPLARKSVLTDPTLWIPVGMAVGSLVGSFFHDTTFGLSIGIMAGSVVTMLIERKRKKTPGRLVIAVGVLAIVVVVVTEVINRV